MKIMPLLSYSYIPIYLVIEKFTQQGMEYSRCALQKNQTESNFVYIRNRDIMDIRFVTKIYPKENSPYERSKFCLCAYTIEIL